MYLYTQYTCADNTTYYTKKRLIYCISSRALSSGLRSLINNAAAILRLMSDVKWDLSTLYFSKGARVSCSEIQCLANALFGCFSGLVAARQCSNMRS